MPWSGVQVPHRPPYLIKNMAENQRQHYVPQFYLKHFCNEDGKLWVYPKSKAGEPFSASPSNVAHERFYYSPEIEGVRLLDIERKFAECEGKAQAVHQKLLQGKLPLSDEDRTAYADFLSLSHVRTPTMRRIFAEMEGARLQALIYAHNVFPQAWETYKEEFESLHGTPPTKEEEEIIKKIVENPSKHLQLDIHRDYTLGALQAAEPLFQAAKRMRWTVLTNTSDEEFVTSDNPLCWAVAPGSIHPFYGPGPLANKTVKISFPLSPERLLLLTWEMGMPLSWECPRQEVKVYNRLRAYNTEEMLFSSSKKQGLINLTNKYKQERPKIEVTGLGAEGLMKVNVKRKL